MKGNAVFAKFPGSPLNIRCSYSSNPDRIYPVTATDFSDISSAPGFARVLSRAGRDVIVPTGEFCYVDKESAGPWGRETVHQPLDGTSANKIEEAVRSAY